MQIKTEGKPQNKFIVSPFYDYFFFVFSPLWAISLAYLLTMPMKFNYNQFLVDLINGRQFLFYALFSPFIHAHLFLVFFRTHLNTDIFKLYKVRFILVPLLLFFLIYFSQWFLIFVAALIATSWDVYHSSMQTFGLGRIYDSKVGNDAKVGRKLDFWLNIVFYIGPILGGLTFIYHLNFLKEFNQVEFGKAFFTSIPIKLYSISGQIRIAVITIGLAYIVYYFYAYYQLQKKGYKVSNLKIMLFGSTAICTLLAWGVKSFGQAFFIVNFFHALQYFAIVWHSEKKNLLRKFKMNNFRFGDITVFIILVGVSYSYGWLAAHYGNDRYGKLFWCVTVVVSIMHFWYDGFIWSVRKKQV